MSMTAAKARAIFTTAVEQYGPDHWQTYVAKACGDDLELRDRVQLLLDAHTGEESVLDGPAVVPSPTIEERLTEEVGAQIGHYKLLQEIGEGGMGVVYMAEQKEPVKRRVALKIIRPGMDTRQVIARFEAERQALAMMDHPNIARVSGWWRDQNRGGPTSPWSMSRAVPTCRVL